MNDMPTNGDANPDPQYSGLPECGTKNTPPCPIALFYRKRNELIYQIAGTRTDRERVKRAAAEVDAYLVSALESGRGLARAAQAGHAVTAGVELIEIDIEAEIAVESGFERTAE